MVFLGDSSLHLELSFDDIYLETKRASWTK